MTETIYTQKISTENFAIFGDVIDSEGISPTIINRGECKRYNDLARLQFSGARLGISIFDANVRSFPYKLDMMERHPLGSQSFIPMTHSPFLVTVAKNLNDTPVEPKAFVTAPGQGINLLAGTWHGVLTPLKEPGRFAVVDRIGSDENLEEFYFEKPFIVEN